ncbi:hypothetical protein PTKIN_Ptkin17bG0107000 [Pterospermum kingtungense]
MEATQKKGFFKGRLAKTFSRVTKRTTTTTYHHHPQCGSSGGCGSTSSKVVPCSPWMSSDSTYSSSGAFITGQKPQNMANYSSVPRVSTCSYATYKQPTSFHEQDPSSVQKVSYASFKPPSFYDQNGYANDTWGHADENVDFKATSYITVVRERFNKLDRVDSTGNKYQEKL